ncbi:uncharacterized protein TrAFT101_003730 [Trichoderma asperellum]|uniref:uncharacterized protein n=1 Tax=Trichoderma asperellum TaxID=101201 RepID=UPI003329B147|nr:hypothetical protein TrAFT101_003730 [Trichoderma asperellum]
MLLFTVKPHATERPLFQRLVIFSWPRSIISYDHHNGRLSLGCDNTLHYRDNCFLMAHSFFLATAGTRVGVFYKTSFWVAYGDSTIISLTWVSYGTGTVYQQS